MRTQQPCVNKERYLFVPHLSCERQSWGPVHSCSPRAVSGLHQAGPVPEACTGRPAHSLTSGLHRREGSFPFGFFLFFLNLTAFPSISLHLSLSLFVTPTLSPLYPSMEGSTGRSHWGKDDEQLYTWASWLFSSRTVAFFSSSPPHFLPFLFLASPQFTFPLFQSGWPIEWGSWGTRYMCGLRGESQWTVTHHNNLQVINQCSVSHWANSMKEKHHPRLRK